MIDLRRGNDHYCLQPGREEDFWGAVRTVTRRFEPGERDYDDQAKEWSVSSKARSEARLTVICENTDLCITGSKAQMMMFQEETREKSGRGEMGTRQSDRGQAGASNTVRGERETSVRTVISELPEVREASVKPS